jgi:hypothetical protein
MTAPTGRVRNFFGVQAPFGSRIFQPTAAAIQDPRADGEELVVHDPPLPVEG